MFNDKTLIRLTRKPGKEDDLLCPGLRELDIEFLKPPTTPGLLGAKVLSRCTPQYGAVILKHVLIYTVNCGLDMKDDDCVYEIDEEVAFVFIRFYPDPEYREYNQDEYSDYVRGEEEDEEEDEEEGEEEVNDDDLDISADASDDSDFDDDHEDNY
ncbi:hypothetical protein AMATHDRAFT_7242 [Amanita thiersii Skay4041]|uniref:Uncharacterized protein n=1 Tax=Amanita thiersii Skay4041 TaxID=703135 RepID=A0A2A9NGW1_9AGAR|nr:hypothetical protein AMATHDRAFT_7242 [Amanita thiersii Skay4041]